MAIMLALFVVPAAVSILLGFFLRKWRSAWSIARTAAISSAPLPALTVGLCVFLFIGAATASREQCGVDACGMMMVATMSTIMMAFAAYVVSLVLTVIVLRSLGKP